MASVRIPPMTIVHWVLAIGLFAYLHLLKARGCRCSTERPAFCRLYTAAGLFVLWRTALLVVLARNPTALVLTADGRPNVAMAAMTGPIYLAFYAAFAWFAYDLWRDRAAACSCAAGDTTMAVLGAGGIVYSVLMALTTFAMMTLFLSVV